VSDDVIRLAIRSLEDSNFKTWVVIIAAALVAAFTVASTLVLGGARQSLDLAMQRLGADIIVVPVGVEAKVENALLMGAPVNAWMPAANVETIKGIPGVARLSPQVYLATLRGATCCTLPEMFLIAYDPETDFTLRPWLEQNAKSGGLAVGEVVGGTFVYVPQGDDQILLYGYGVDLVGNLAQTGTGMDSSMFLTMDTAREIARQSYTNAERPLIIEPNSVSSVLVRVEPGTDPSAVAAQIRKEIAGVTPIESARLFGTQRTLMAGLLKSIAALLAIVWALSASLVGIVFSLIVNERRREMGVLRALGAPRMLVAQALFVEAGILGLVGGVIGAGLSAFSVYLFHGLIVQIMRVPFLYPDALHLLGLLVATLGVTLLTVALAVAWPALQVSFQEPATAMRE
jgi:putative ABC transport system permease protein